jgi:hypothetical protein
MLIIGDRHDFIAYYVLRSESWKEMAIGLRYLNDRLERLGTIGELEEWWSDRCCDGATDTTNHPIVSIFRNSRLRRAPRKDKFHGINGVNKTGNEGMPDQKAELGTDLFESLSFIPDSELAPVISYLRNKDNKLDSQAARRKARADYRHSGIIRSRSYGRTQQLSRWQATRARWATRARLDRDRGERSVIRREVGKLKGTLEEMERLEPCIAKGCLEDPWEMEDMYLDTKVQPITGLQARQPPESNLVGRRSVCSKVIVQPSKDEHLTAGLRFRATHQHTYATCVRGCMHALCSVLMVRPSPVCRSASSAARPTGTSLATACSIRSSPACRTWART